MFTSNQASANLPKEYHPFLLNDEQRFPNKESSESKLLPDKIRRILSHFFRDKRLAEEHERRFQERGIPFRLLFSPATCFSDKIKFLGELAGEQEVVIDVSRKITVQEVITSDKGLEHIHLLKINEFEDGFLSRGKQQHNLITLPEKREHEWRLFVKEDRTNIPVTADTNIRRVLIADKVEKILNSEIYKEHFVVAKQFIYEDSGKHYVVSEGLEIQEIVKPGPLGTRIIEHRERKLEAKKSISSLASEETRDSSCCITDEESNGGIGEISDRESEESDGGMDDTSANERSLTPIQAKGLAECVFDAGLQDLTDENIRFTKDGRVAIFDTEPVLDFVKKNHWFNRLIRDRSLFDLQIALHDIAQLKVYCEGDAIKEVDRVTTKRVLWGVAKAVMKIALACLALNFVPGVIASLSLGVAAAPVKYVLLTAIAYKVTELVCSTLKALELWKWSRQIQGKVGNEKQEYAAYKKVMDWITDEKIRAGYKKHQVFELPSDLGDV